MCSAGSPARSGQGFCPLLPARERETGWEACQSRLSAFQVQEERFGKFPSHRCHSRIRKSHPTAAPGVVAIEGTGLPSGEWCAHPERHGQRESGTLVRFAPGGDGDSRSARGQKAGAGVDLGINRMAQVSDGHYFENPRALKRALTRLKRLQRVVSRRQKGSANHQKAVRQLAKAHFRVSNIRKDALHQATTWLAKTKSAIVLENLNVSGMMKNHHLAQAIADVGMYEFRRQLQYKGAWYGCEVVPGRSFLSFHKTLFTMW